MLIAADELRAGPLILRRWRAADVDVLYRAVCESLEHLAPWMAWAEHGFSTDDAATHIARSEDAWGTDYDYGVTVEGGLVGSCSLTTGIGPGGFEIGYWVHPRHVGHGYATAAAAALTAEAFRIGADRVEIVHDVANVRSGAVPRRLGFTEVERRPGPPERPAGEAGVYVVWRMRAPDLV